MTNPPIPPALVAQARLAVTDLAQRLKIDPDGIGVIEARVVIWPNGSLGCPRPGMGYRQVPQEGALIRLSAQGREYAYHSGSRQQPFLCDKAD